VDWADAKRGSGTRVFYVRKSPRNTDTNALSNVAMPGTKVPLPEAVLDATRVNEI
jgi:hypothetical protein